MTLTLKACGQAADESGITIYGDTEYRGDCHKEDSDLASFFSWVRFNYPEYASLIFHYESEFNPVGGSSYGYHAKSKAKGRVDGLADIVCLPISKNSPAFICELKRADVSKSLASKKRKEHFLTQLTLLKSQAQHGAFACVALGLYAAKEAFIKYVELYK